MGYVYLIGSTVFGWYKIGKSITPEVRIKDPGILLPFKIEIIGIWSAYNHHAMETALHEMYKDCRINGEWFEFSKKKAFEVFHSIPSETRIYPSKLENSFDKFSNIIEDTKNERKIIGVRTQKLRGNFTQEERNYIRDQDIEHQKISKKISKVTGYSDREKSFILVCNKYCEHKNAKINIFRSILS